MRGFRELFSCCMPKKMKSLKERLKENEDYYKIEDNQILTKYSIDGDEEHKKLGTFSTTKSTHKNQNLEYTSISEKSKVTKILFDDKFIRDEERNIITFVNIYFIFKDKGRVVGIYSETYE